MNVLTLATKAVRAVTPPRLMSGYGDDLIQETAIKLLELDRPGMRIAKMLARRARRQIFGDRRYRPAWDDNVFLEELQDAITPALRAEGVLCMVRLQRAWPTLTEHQQAALLSMLDGDRRATGEAAAALGSSSTAIIQARKTALRRIDDPYSFARVAQRKVRQMTADEHRAYNREKARRSRERRKANA